MNMKMGCIGADETMIQLFRENGLTLTALKADWNDDEETVRQLQSFDCWVNNGQRCTADMLQRLSGSLKMVCRNGIGYDQIDVACASRLGICVTNTAGSMNVSVGTAALLLMLETLRKAYLFNRRLMDNGNFDRSGIVGHELDSKTVGLIGFGGIARKTAAYLKGFDCRLLVYDVFQDMKAVEQYGIEYVTLEELARNADVVSVHCPLSESTHHLVNSDFLAKMKPSAILVNTARGPIVDEAALIDALKNGVIAGAGLDVYEQEPPTADNPLLSMDNVYALPHVGSFSVESRMRTMELSVKNILDFAAGKQPCNCLNPEYAKGQNE